MEARPQCFHEEEVLLLRKLQERAQLGGVGGDGLLAEDVLASEQRIL